MHFDSFSDFLQMGGYAFYVWLAFGVTFASLVGVYWEQNWRIKRLQSQVKMECERIQRIKKAREQKSLRKNT